MIVRSSVLFERPRTEFLKDSGIQRIEHVVLCLPLTPYKLSAWYVFYRFDLHNSDWTCEAWTGRVCSCVTRNVGLIWYSRVRILGSKILKMQTSTTRGPISNNVILNQNWPKDMLAKFNLISRLLTVYSYDIHTKLYMKFDDKRKYR